MGRTSEGTTWDVDKRILKQDPSRVLEFWLRKRPTQDNFLESFSIDRYLFKCSRREYREADPGGTTYWPIPPGTMIEAVMDKVCAVQVKVADHERWLSLGTTSDGTTWDIDKRTMKRDSSGRIDLWVRKMPKESSFLARFSVDRYLFDCAAREYREGLAAAQEGSPSYLLAQ